MENKEETLSPADSARSLMELLSFHHYGQRPAAAGAPEFKELKPSLLFAHQDLSKVRYDYPVCLLSAGAESPAKPLRTIVDDAVANAEEGEGRDRLSRDLGKLEFAIKGFVEAGEPKTFSQLIEAASNDIIAKGGGDRKGAGLRKELAASAAMLDAEGEVIGFDAEAPVRLMAAVGTHVWNRSTSQFARELDQLITQLGYVLHHDFRRSPEASSVGHLETALAAQFADDMDFHEMSELLARTRPGLCLPVARRKRIETALAEMKKSRGLFPEFEAKAKPVPILKDCAKAAERHRSTLRSLTGFFKSVRIARLEVENRYREDIHDRFFGEFGPAHLSAEEIALTPPLMVRLRSDSLDPADKSALVELLASKTPVKALVTIDDASGLGASADETGGAAWTARLASMALAQNGAYVLQSVHSNAVQMIRGMREGFAYAGPALFSVYTGESVKSGIADYLASASALESRAFPAFSYDPGKGSTWLERFDLAGNPQGEKPWSVGRFSARNGADAEVSLEADFTFADFAAVDSRLAGHFLPIAKKERHDNLTPLADFLELDAAGAVGKIPYIQMIDSEGSLWKVVVSRSVAEAARRCAGDWRSLQEFGGINNSHVLKIIADEKRRLEDEKNQEVSAIEEKYKDQLDRSVGGLASEIIQRIASVLLDPGAAQGLAAGAPAAPTDFLMGPGTARLPAAAPEAAPAAAAEEDDEVSFDEPYIDTPLCTSCNDCTKRNPRIFAYDKNKQAFIKDASAGPFRDLVLAAEACPVKIIHVGKPKNPGEQGLAELIKRAEKFK